VGALVVAGQQVHKQRHHANQFQHGQKAAELGHEVVGCPNESGEQVGQVPFPEEQQVVNHQ